MPVDISVPIVVFDQPSFHVVDQMVTGLAFDIHNEFGRFLNERLYQAELLRRLNGLGIESQREIRITVSLDGFAKDYFIDLLVNNGVIVETKTADTISAAHRAQVLTYLFLCGLHHGTVVNFRPERVQHEFVSSHLTRNSRQQVTFLTEHWNPISDRCQLMASTLRRAMADWGSCLEPALYRDAMTHVLGGELQVVRDIPVFSSSDEIGSQKVHLLTEDVAFSVTASVHRPKSVLEHHRRFLEHTPLKAIQWINLNRQTVNMVTIRKGRI